LTPFFEAPQLVVFGRVIRGMDVVDSLEADDRILSIRVAKDENGKEIRRNHAYNPHPTRLK
jgi:cyclophilin family peptidyl-prolyl cis-trans isomerase